MNFLRDDGRDGRAFGPGEATVQPGGTTLPLSAVRAAEVAAETAPGRTLTAEWALWGKDVYRTELHVLRCSKGPLNSDDFQEIFTRYATGVKEHLPQYTICWIPADQGRPPYLAVAIHELADDPAKAAGRSQHVAGRVVEYVRLFAFPYDEVARLQAGYASLIDAVQGELLGPGRTDLIRVRLSPSAGLPDSVSPRADLAQAVASRLLARSPVCVLDADGVSARDRLLFIDEVMSLLPFGLRATLSASTWASPTARDLKLRLFFSSARRDSGTRTTHESWVSADLRARPAGTDDVTQLYLEWLGHAGPGATSKLAGMKGSVRFTEGEIRDVIRRLPEDRTPEECAKDLSDALRANEPTEVLAALAPLKLYFRKRAKSVDPREFSLYRELAKKYWLFKNYPTLDYQVRSDVYRTLLDLGFTDPLTYLDYCDIRYSARDHRLAGPLRVLLLAAMPPPDTLVYILAVKAGPHISDAHLMDDLAGKGLRPPDLLRYLVQRLDSVTEQRDKVTLIDFAVDYLARDRDHQAELIQQGYLSEFLARAYPDDISLQAEKLNYTIRLAHGIVDGSEGLNVKQIREIFANPRVNQAGPIRQAVKGLAMSRSWTAFEQGEKNAKSAREGGPQHRTVRTPPFPRPQLRRSDRDRVAPTRVAQPEPTRVLDQRELRADDFYEPVTFNARRDYLLIGGLCLIGGLLIWAFIVLFMAY